MKYYAYIKNEINEFLGIFKLNDNHRKIEKKDFPDKIYLNDELTNYNCYLYEILKKNLKELNIAILQYKCLKKIKNELIFLVKVSSIKKDIALIDFTSLSSNTNSYKNTCKVISSYLRTIKKGKKEAIINAVKSQISKLDVVMFVVEVILFAFSITLAFLKNPVNSGVDSFSFFSTISILFLSIFVILLQSLKKIVQKINKGLKFKDDSMQSSQIEGTKKEKIIENVLNNFSKTYKDFTYIRFDDDIFIFSKAENSIFDEVSGKLKVIKENSKLNMTSESRSALAYIIGEKLENDKTIFNGLLLGINSELNFSRLKEVIVKDVNYHTYVSTDEMIFKNICLKSDPTHIISGEILTLNPLTKGLKDIKNSHLTNLIGINIIVELLVNNDVYYLVNMQSMYNDVNGLKFIPSASGSLDELDYERMLKEKKTSFKDLLLIGMLRELSEESYLKLIDNKILGFDVVELKLLGFSRLLSKAGKPDFFGKVSLKLNSLDDINNILNNYNLSQNANIAKKGFELETIKMMILSKEKFFSDEFCKLKSSPQLEYIRYLLIDSLS